MADLVFSGDSRYLLTSYEEWDAPQRRGHRFVAWDVEDRAPTVLEEPGHYWLPNVGSAPTGVVWVRGHNVYRAGVETGERASLSVPQAVVEVSWGPDGTAFAYIGRHPGRVRSPWRLYAGRTFAEAHGRALPLGVDARQLLGWRDSTHVVVGDYGRSAYVVDVVSGEVEKLDIGGAGRVINQPLLAGDLWRNPLVAPPDREGTSDARAPFRWAGGLLLALLAVLGVLRRRQRRVRSRQECRTRWMTSVRT